MLIDRQLCRSIRKGKGTLGADESIKQASNLGEKAES